MDRQLLAAALRVLRASYSGSQVAEQDLLLVRENALPSEHNLEDKDLAISIVWRIVQTVPPTPARASVRRMKGR
jgi:hypothetical protein